MLQHEIHDEMKQSYIDYAMSVIVSRALPEIDGFKPANMGSSVGVSKAKNRDDLKAGTEIVGLCPMKALIDAAEYYLQIENFDFERQVLENYLL